MLVTYSDTANVLFVVLQTSVDACASLPCEAFGIMCYTITGHVPVWCRAKSELLDARAVLQVPHLPHSIVFGLLGHF